MNRIEAHLVDIPKRSIYPVAISFEQGVIQSIAPIASAPELYVMPGFVDAHVHIESSLLVPTEFARIALVHGTVATISDPHEIANVLGIKGVEFMIENGNQSPLYFNFGAPSCVPATIFETAGAALSPEEVGELMQREEVLYLSEMMNYPGVLYDDAEVLQKIKYAHAQNKPVDGHAPGLRGDALKKYIAAGISTDHECFTLEEALEKISLGMKILIREGSAARNFDALIPLMKDYAASLMFCSDDKHPDSLELGHINQLVARAVALGYNLFDVLQVACLNPVEHYHMKHGQLRVGDAADFIVLNNLSTFEVKATYIHGNCVAQEGICLVKSVPVQTPNSFVAKSLLVEQLRFEPSNMEPVIVCEDGQLVTGKEMVPKELLLPENDYLKLVVYNRYQEAKPAIAYIKNFGIKGGAIAGSVAHDSHNILAVGSSDEHLVKAIEQVIKHQGALSACNENTAKVLPLPVAGLMSNGEAWQVAEAYKDLDRFAKVELGSGLRAPFMSLSFMALLVIPHLKLSDKGLFSGDTFDFVRSV
jgi:adenine deaminase